MTILTLQDALNNPHQRGLEAVGDALVRVKIVELKP